MRPSPFTLFRVAFHLPHGVRSIHSTTAAPRSWACWTERCDGVAFHSPHGESTTTARDRFTQDAPCPPKPHGPPSPLHSDSGPAPLAHSLRSFALRLDCLYTCSAMLSTRSAPLVHSLVPSRNHSTKRAFGHYAPTGARDTKPAYVLPAHSRRSLPRGFRSFRTLAGAACADRRAHRWWAKARRTRAHSGINNYGDKSHRNRRSRYRTVPHQH